MAKLIKHEVVVLWHDRPYANHRMETEGRAAAIAALRKGATEAEASKILMKVMLAGQRTTGMNLSIRINGRVFMFD